jgi:DNA-binding MarR family transcriptional regulator
LVERRRSTKDRRHSELVLTTQGQRTLDKLSNIAAKERDTLATSCRKIIAHQGLTPEVHPGYRKL